jgi:outer membrane protein assembly factor BamB
LVLRQAGVLLAVGDTLVAGMAGRLVGLNPQRQRTLGGPIASARVAPTTSSGWLIWWPACLA